MRVVSAQPWPWCAMNTPRHMCHAFVGCLGQVDRGRLAAELEVHLLHRRSGLRHDLAADLRGAGERDHVDGRVRRDQLAAFDRLVDHDVEHARRQARGLGRFAEQHRRQRRQRARPQHERATRHQRRQRLPHVQVEGEVVGRDRAHHTDRLVHVHAHGDVAGRSVPGRRDRVVLLLRELEVEVGNGAGVIQRRADLDRDAFSYGARLRRSRCR